MQYGGNELFGTEGTYCVGPRHEYRALRQWLPGIDGYRIYRLGRTHGGLWVCGGRLVAANKGVLELLIDQFGKLNDGKLRTFVSSGDVAWPNCQLVSYEAERAEKVFWNSTAPVHTCVVRGIITRAAP